MLHKFYKLIWIFKNQYWALYIAHSHKYYSFCQWNNLDFLMNYFIFTAFKMLLTDVRKQLLANTGERKFHSPDLFLSNPSINICTNTVLNHAEHYLIRYSNKSSN